MHKTMGRTTMGARGPPIAMKGKLVKVLSSKIMAMPGVGLLGCNHNLTSEKKIELIIKPLKIKETFMLFHLEPW
jgi:hypothetical protein